MPLPRRLAAALAAIALLAAACTQATSGRGTRLGAAVPGTPAPAPISFRDCTAQAGSIGLGNVPALGDKLRVGCGRLEVPLDYAHPSGRTIALTVLRLHDTDNTTSPVQSLLFNPGGPGASGIRLGVGFATQLSARIYRAYDVILFDPRGTETSSPIHCLTNSQKDTFFAAAPDPTTPAGFVQAKRLAERVAAACTRAEGSALPFYNTVNTARDMDQIRQAVGDDRMNYFGFSYGTELGWVYAHLFPHLVRAVVLDGAVDPETQSVSQFGQQVAAFEQAFDQFTAYCKQTAPCNRMSDPRAVATAVAAKAEATPLPTGSARKLTKGLALTGIFEAMYGKQLWPRLATALLSAREGDGKELLALADRYAERSADGQYTNLLDANTTIGCNDSEPGPTDSQVHRLAASWAARYPLFGRWQAVQLFTCQPWQAHRTPIPKPHAATPTKVLVVGNIHDPATPYRGAQDLTRDLGNAALLTWNGQGHTSYLEGSSCVDSYVNRYLLTLSVPPAHTVCPAR